MSWHGTRKASKIPFMSRSNIIVFDLETTGLSSNVDEILQITILDGSGCVLFSEYIKPKFHRFWPAAEAINHISYDMVKDEHHFSYYRAEIQELFDRAELIVGYNVNFDIKFIKEAGIIVTGKVFDVMTAFANYRADVDKTIYRRCRLSECAEYFGYSYHGHDSYEDAKVTQRCFESLISDQRFTTYQRNEKKQLKKIERTRPETRLTFALGTKKPHPIIWGVIMVFIGMSMLTSLTGMPVNDLSTYLLALKYTFSLSPIPRAELLWHIITVLGAFKFVKGTILGILRFPKWLIRKIKRIFHKDDYYW